MYPGYGLVIFVLELVVKRGLIRSTSLGVMKTYTYAEIQDEVRAGRGLFVYEHTVIDLTRYMLKHPGVNLLEPYVGTEISRYIYGNFMCGKNEIYRHSTSTDDVIALTRVGFVEPSFPLFTLLCDLQSSQKPWKLIAKKDLGHGHALFSFGHQHTKVQAIIPGVNHCGTYVTVSRYPLMCSFTRDVSMWHGTTVCLFCTTKRSMMPT